MVELLALLLKLIAFPEPGEITRRSHLERWAKRALRKKKILVIAYFLGASPLFLLAVYFTVLSAFRGNAISPNSVISSIIPGFLCSGPIILFLVWAVLSSGISSYQRLVERLKISNRVCSVCSEIALYEDRYYLPSKQAKHTRSDLVPYLHVIKEDGKTHVLCDACLSEVRAIGSP